MNESSNKKNIFFILERLFFKYYAYVLVGCVILIGISVLIGWYINSPKLIQIFPYFVPMQFNTALGFFLAGVAALIIFSKQYYSYALIIGSIVFLMGLLTALQYFLNISIGIDELFIKHYITVETSHPGRMAPNTALCFFLAGVVLSLCCSRAVFYEKNLILKMLTLIILILSGLALIGYILNASTIYGWGNLTRMALHTSLSFMLWSAAMLCWFRYDYPLKKDMPRNVFGQCIFAFLVTAALSMLISYALLLKEKKDVRRMISSTASQIIFAFQSEVETHIQSLKRMASRWDELGMVDGSLWEVDSNEYLKHYDEISSIVFLDKNHNIRWINTKKNKQELTEIIENDKQLKKIIFEVMQNDTYKVEIVAPGSSDFKEGWIVIPFKHKDEVDGVLLVTYQYSTLMKQLLSKINKNLYGVRLAADESVLFTMPFTHNNYQLRKTWGRESSFNHAGIVFKIYIWPTNEMIGLYLSWAPSFVLVIGVLLALFVAMLTHYFNVINISNNKVKMILDSVGEGIYGLDEKGTITFINPAALRMLKFKENELKGNNPHALFHHSYKNKEPYPISECPICSPICNSIACEIDSEVFWRKDLSYFEVEYGCFPMRNDPDNMRGSVVIFKSISKRKKMEKDIKDKNGALERINKELESFSYSVSHDLRAPLRHIMGFVGLLDSNKENKFSKQGKRHIEIIKRSTKQLDNLIDDLLAYSRAGRLELNMTCFSLGELFLEVLDEFSSEIKDRDISVSVNNMPDIFADRNLIKLVVSNLVGNALKFTKEKDKAVIECHASEDDEKFIINVSDNGVGFDKKYASQIFEIFKRLHKDSEFKGTGIGLANVQRIVERHNGSVYAKGELNKGATIYFTLPKLNKI